MTVKNTSKTIARAVQDICEREHGKSPPYTLVLGIVQRRLGASNGLAGKTREEYAALVFETEKEALLR